MEKRSVTIQNGLQAEARWEPPNYLRGQGPTCSAVAVSVTGAKASSWRLRVFAEMDGEMVAVGAVRTLPGSKGTRLVAVATCPGAKAWSVRADRVTPPTGVQGFDADGEIDVRITAADVGALPGVCPVPGNSDRAIMKAHKAGVSGAVSIPGRVTGWGAYAAVGVPGTVLLDGAGNLVPVPAGGLVAGGERPEQPWPNEFVFTNTASYFVEYEINQTGGAV
jgi:hypothetical protein